MKNKKTINHKYVCKKCGKLATINIQSIWKKYRITKTGKFILEKEWGSDEYSEYYCDKCSKD